MGKQRCTQQLRCWIPPPPPPPTPPRTGTITVRKVSAADVFQLFDFTGDLGNFSLDIGESETFLNLPPGPYHIEETLPQDWVLTNITIMGGSGVTGATAADVNLMAGQNVVVTFTNQLPVEIEVLKELVNPPGGVVINDFNLIGVADPPNDALNFNVNGNGTVQVFVRVPYLLSETGPPGDYTLELIPGGTVAIIGTDTATVGTGGGSITFRNTYP